MGSAADNGELLMLGLEVSESTVGRYMIRTRRPRSQGWKTFLRNQAGGIASIDLFVVRTISFKLLYGLVILDHARRRMLRIAVTSNPSAEWIAGQVTEAFPWSEAPRHLIRDRDCAFGPAYTRRIRAMVIRDHPIAPRSPWQNGHVERLIGSIRRECLDHLVVSGEAHLRSSLKTYALYYNEVRTHLSLGRRPELSTFRDGWQRRRDANPGRAASSMPSALSFEEAQPGKLIPGSPLGYQFQWWTFPGAEDHAYSAEGVFFQFIYVNPRENVVIVKTSANDGFWDPDKESEIYAAYDAITLALHGQ